MDLQGTQNADTLTGGADNDTIYGFAGNDTVKGLAGDDVLAGHDGNDNLQGGVGDDYILGGAGNDTIDGGAGNDWAAYEDATAGVKVDLNITGTQNTVGGGTDKLIGIENVYGSAFNDTLTGNADNNMLVGDAGADVVSGGKGDDTLWGDAGNDTLDGGDGDDYMVGGAGDDIIKGGAGVDWSSYENATAGVTVDLNKTTAQDTIGAGKDTITGVELLYGSKFDDILTGDAKDNYLWGSDGNDKLYGGAGDDHLSGGSGNNWINGGDGFDTVDYAFSDEGVTINLSMGAPPMGGSPLVGDWLTSVEAAMGSAHDDVITGNVAENYLFGDAGDDVINAVGGHDTLDGGDGNDYLYGSGSGTSDLLIGGKGDDHILVVSGASVVDGGEGVDTFQVLSLANLKIDLRITGDQEIAPGLHVELRNIENLIGSQGNDVLIGDAKDNVLMGGAAGNDTMDGGEGSDTVTYLDDGKLGSVIIDLGKSVQVLTDGRGTDTLISIENVIATSGADQITGNASANHLGGEDGNDWLEAIGGNDILEGGYGDDTLIATREGISSDKLFGGAGNDQLVTNKSGALLDGGEGDDRFNVSHFANLVGTVVIEGGAGNDTLDMRGAYGPIADLTINLATQGRQDVGQGQFLDIKGVENILGGSGNDRLTGDAGDNLLAGGAGDDVLDGGAGVDIASYDDYNFQTAVKVDLRNAVQTELGGRGTDTLISIEGVRGTAYDDTLIGNDKDNLFIGGKGLNHIDGGAGNDTISYIDVEKESDGLNGVLFVNLRDGNALNYHSQDILTSIENVVGSNFTDHITGSAQVNILDGGLGDDNLLAVGDGDSLFGGAGNDWLEQDRESSSVFMDGGAGNDRLILNSLTPKAVVIGGDGVDTIVFNGSDLDTVKGITYSLAVKTAQDVTGHGSSVTATGFENIVGSQGDDHLYGDDGDNVIAGGLGADHIDGGKGFDIVDYSVENSGESVSIDLKVSVQTASGNHGPDTLVSIEGVIGTAFADTLVGDAQNNFLSGLDGADILDGGAGDDTLVGGRGVDTMTGGAGVDTFVFHTGDLDDWSYNDDSRVDVIKDFQSIDKLSFDPHIGPRGYNELTTSSWLGAKTIAPQAMATQGLAHLAIQVGADTYVFSARSGAPAGTIDNIVKLVGVGLDTIGAENFV